MGAKEAILEYEVIEEKEGLTLVRVNLKTGRPHQIRVQFSNIGNSIYGDYKYGLKDILEKSKKNNKNIALWSHSIEFNHPGTKESVNYTSNPPKQYPWNIFNLLS